MRANNHLSRRHQTGLAALYLAAAALGATYPPDVVLSSQTPMPTGISRPGYLQPVTDPTYGTTVVRITDRQALSMDQDVIKHSYSKTQPWNADGSLLFLGGQYPCPILDGETYEYVRTIHQPSQAVWSNTESDYMYGTHAGTARFVKFDVRTDWSSVILHDFTEYDYIDFGGSEGNISNDDRYVALFGVKGDSSWVFVYDIPGDLVVSRLSLGTRGVGATSNSDVNNVTMSQSGDYVVIQYNNVGSERFQGIEAFDRDLNFLRQLRVNQGGHIDFGYDTGGFEVMVAYVDGERALGATRLDNGETITILASSLMNYAIHVSCRNTDRPGWVYLSEFAYENRDQSPYTDKAIHQELLAIRIDGSGVVEHFGHEHHAVNITEREYVRAPMGVPNRDGSKVLWASDWDDESAAAEIHTYVAMMPQQSSIAPGNGDRPARLPIRMLPGGHYLLSGGGTQALEGMVLTTVQGRVVFPPGPSFPASGRSPLPGGAYMLQMRSGTRIFARPLAIVR